MKSDTNVPASAPVRIRADIKARLKAHAIANGRKIQWIVDRAVTEYLEKLEARHESDTRTAAEIQSAG